MNASSATVTDYDALLIVSFGGPEKMDDVMPFLENVLRGRNVPRERMLEVAEHYYHFGGKSPINDQTRELIVALRKELDQHQISLPIYWGNRNWHPYLTDTMQELKDKGYQRVLAFFVAGYSSYSSCRQYRENVITAQDAVGDGAPVVDKIRVFYNHPLFIEANTELIKASIAQLSPEEQSRYQIAFTAHSIPMSMADTSDYEKQLLETSRLITESLGIPPERTKLVYQSRSGRPQDPWLEPDILDHIAALKAAGQTSLVIAPIGFLSDHMEILFDLDTEAHDKCVELGMEMVRAPTVGIHPKFIAMIRELIEERVHATRPKNSCGQYGPNHDVCPIDCCPAPKRPAMGRPADAK
jgi:ferrochelatase